MNLTTLDYGSVVCPDDPGEPTTGKARISVTSAEAMFLADLAQRRHVLEIGTGLGVSTRALASRAVKVTSIDPDPWVHANVWPKLPPKVRVTASRSAIIDVYDLVFIDADHTTESTTADIAFAREHCPVGLIVVHDAKIDKVRAALDDSYAYVDTYHGMAVKFVGWDRA